MGKKKRSVVAKIDTGAWRTSIDRELAEEIGLEKLGVSRNTRSSFGEGCRELVSLRFLLDGKEIITKASLSNRSRMKYKVIIGRKDLQGMVIKVKE
jgi:hypothetical protein